MPARQHAASVGIIPTLNRKIATAAPTESRSAQGSTLENFGASNANRKARTGSTSWNTVWMANREVENDAYDSRRDRRERRGQGFVAAERFHVRAAQEYPEKARN